MEGHSLGSGLDYYKATMSQAAWMGEPDIGVTFSLHNRGPERFLDHVDPARLGEHLGVIAEQGWAARDLEFLGSIAINEERRPAFSKDFLTYLGSSSLPPVEISHNRQTNDLAVETIGARPLVTFWETTVMGAVSELYFEDYLKANDISLEAVYKEGDRRLDEKIALLRAHPDIKIADFGTRRRFSLEWQRHVLERLVTECPDNLLGTSNIALAREFGIKPIGTFAHEMPMIDAALADIRGQSIRGSHHTSLENWYKLYGAEYSIALTDTFGTDFFFEDFTPEQAWAWRGLRHDSGDPFDFGERAIRFYKELGIDPKTKVLIFSDTLNMPKVMALKEQFGSRITEPYGIGKDLMNDLGIQSLNFVMKATRVWTPEGTASTVKLSDDAGKHTGPPEYIGKYGREFGPRVRARATIF